MAGSFALCAANRSLRCRLGGLLPSDIENRTVLILKNHEVLFLGLSLW